MQDFTSISEMKVNVPDEKVLERMVIEENELRTSEWYINECNKVKHIPNGWLKVTDDLQEDLVKRYGYTYPSLSFSIALYMLRNARSIYPDNHIFVDVPIYVRENTARVGTLQEQQDIPDVCLYDIDGNESSLYKILLSSQNSDQRPVLLLAGNRT